MIQLYLHLSIKNIIFVKKEINYMGSNVRLSY